MEEEEGVESLLFSLPVTLTPKAYLSGNFVCLPKILTPVPGIPNFVVIKMPIFVIIHNRLNKYFCLNAILVIMFSQLQYMTDLCN